MNKVMERTPDTNLKTMSPVHEGWPPFEGLGKEMERLFRSGEPDVWRMPGLGWTSLLDSMNGRSTAPLDVVRTETGYEVSVELPGMSEKDVEVTYADGMLTISGEKTEESRKDKTGMVVSERRHGSFRRSLRVPGSVDPEKIEGHVEHGVLTIVLPVPPEARSSERKIEVSSR